MAGGWKQTWLRPPRKIAFAMGGVFLMLTASGAAAYLMGGAGFLMNGGSPVYGLDCTLADRVAFTQADGSRWVRKYIMVEGSDGPGRVRTAVRVARDAAEKDAADLVLVVILDRSGPHELASMRGNAIGAEVIYAPHPARVRAMDAMFSASYTKAIATGTGQFYGDRVSLDPAAISAMAAEMTSPYGCEDRTAEAARKAKASADETPAKADH
jgi:hypothetical protein